MSLDLTHLKELEAKATQGKWVKTQDIWDADFISKEHPSKEEEDQNGGGIIAQAYTETGDTDFIIAIRNAFPDICAEIDRLRLQLADANLPSAQHSSMMGLYVKQSKELEALCAESVQLMKEAIDNKGREAKWKEIVATAKEMLLKKGVLMEFNEPE